MASLSTLLLNWSDFTSYSRQPLKKAYILRKRVTELICGCSILHRACYLGRKDVNITKLKKMFIISTHQQRYTNRFWYCYHVFKVVAFFLQSSFPNQDVHALGVVTGRQGLSIKPIIRQRQRSSQSGKPISNAMNILNKQPMMGLIFEYLRRPLLDVNVFNNQGRTPFRFAVEQNNVDIVRMIIDIDGAFFQSKFDVNAKGTILN